MKQYIFFLKVKLHNLHTLVIHTACQCHQVGGKTVGDKMSRLCLHSRYIYILHVEIVLWVTAHVEGHHEWIQYSQPGVLNWDQWQQLQFGNAIYLFIYLLFMCFIYIFIFESYNKKNKGKNSHFKLHIYPDCRQWSSYLAANDGADLVVRRCGCSGDVGVAVAEAAGTVQIEAGWANSWASHGCIMNRTSQPPGTWEVKRKGQYITNDYCQ